MVSFLRSNLVWMLLSLLLSTGLWVFVTFKLDPEVTHFLPNIPVQIQGKPNTMVVSSETTSVQVEVSASSAVWAQLTPDKLHATVDASKVIPGSQEVDVKVASTDPRVRVESVEPGRVFLKVEPLQTKSVPVKVTLNGTVPLGFKSGTAKATPDQIAVVGPESLVNQVTSVAVGVNLDGVTHSIDDTYRPVPLGLSTADAARITMNPGQVLVDLPVTQQILYKSLAVQANVVGNPALGYQLVGVTVDPLTVTLVGDPETLNQMSTVLTQPIDVSGADGDRAFDTSLMLPGTVALDRSQSIVVRVLVSTVNGSKTMLVSPQVTNLGPNLSYTINPGAVNVTLSGPIPILNRIQPGDVQVAVDATGIISGTLPVNVQVKGPDLLNVVSVQPQRVTLTVK